MSAVVIEHAKSAICLKPYLEKLGFNLAAYGCTTCIGNSGPLKPTKTTSLAKSMPLPAGREARCTSPEMYICVP